MAKAAERLSANLAALSYAMDLAGRSAEAPLQVRVEGGRRPGPVESRRMSGASAYREDMALELEQGKPLKNFGRRLAWEAGISLPYNMRQSAEAAEQAQINYLNEGARFGDMAELFAQQMRENETHAADSAEARVYRQYAAAGELAAKAFFQPGASAEQRASAAAQLAQLDAEARQVRNADSNDRTKYVRQFLGQELASSRTALVQLDMGEKDRVTSLESELAQLDNAQPGSTEEQVILRAMLTAGVQRSQSGLAHAATALGGAAAVTGNPYAIAVGAAAQVAGAVLQNETAKLDRDDVIRMRLEMHDAMDSLTSSVRPELVRLHEGVASDASSYGIPRSSWTTERVALPTPYADAQRARLFERGESREPGPAPAPTLREQLIEEHRERQALRDMPPALRDMR